MSELSSATKETFDQKAAVAIIELALEIRKNVAGIYHGNNAEMQIHGYVCSKLDECSDLLLGRKKLTPTSDPEAPVNDPSEEKADA